MELARALAERPPHAIKITKERMRELTRAAVSTTFSLPPGNTSAAPTSRRAAAADARDAAEAEEAMKFRRMSEVDLRGKRLFIRST
jgi:hypothetical protein